MSETYAKRTALKRTLNESKIEKGPSEASPGSSKRQKIKKSQKTYSNRLPCSIPAGTVLILLTGKHRGKRVIFLKEMKSGLLLITGPYGINGVPLRRAHLKSVISTTTQIGVNIPIPDYITDGYFSQPKLPKATELFNTASSSTTVSCSDERKSTQKLIDEIILDYIKTVPHLKAYLSQKFSLSKGQLPHEMSMSEVVIADPKELLKDLLQLQETHGPLGEGDNEMAKLQEKLGKLITELRLQIEGGNTKSKSVDVFGFTSDESSTQSASITEPTRETPDDVSTEEPPKMVESTVHLSARGYVSGSDTSTSSSTKGSAKLSKYGESALQHAAGEGDLKTVRECIESGMACSHRDYNRLTPLHDAVKGEHVEVVELLLQNDAPINAVGGERNSTPLHMAAESENLSIVKLLLEYGANPGKTDSNGMKPVELALTKKVIQMIKKATARHADSLSDEEEKVTNGSEMNRTLSSIPPPPNPIIYFHSSLDAKGKKPTKATSAQLKKKYNKTFTAEIKKATHFACDGEAITDGKFKWDYLEALYSNCWIVSEEYLKSGSERDTVVSCFDNAPARVTIAHFHQEPAILSGLKVFFDRSVSAETRKRCGPLVKVAGGRVLTREPKPDHDAVQADREVIQARPDCQYTHIIIYETRTPSTLVKRGKVATVHVDWLIKSLSRFTVSNLE